ncbi:exported hypothetical protein [Vibrio coralliirubri]|uniref:hypothetical protein n=1 Tax=Vibrio coralliirubri TaxID=1516159 RepID=UPI000633E018|nr:hypothetical protein [Vibrio coralliirubri]CDU04669.1 exported hypothetical protein [Vibrio coralliirubri]
MKVIKQGLLSLAIVAPICSAEVVETKWTREITEECGVVIESIDTGQYGLGGFIDATPVALSIRNNVQDRSYSLVAITIDESDFENYAPEFVIHDTVSGTSKPLSNWTVEEIFPFSQKEIQFHAYTSSPDVQLPSESATLRITWQITCG